jgi:hypothetical protein
MTGRVGWWLALGLVVVAPRLAMAEEVVVTAERVVPEVGGWVAKALKVEVVFQPSDQVPLIAPMGNRVLLYNQAAMVKLVQEHGHETVAGLLGHWVGHLKNRKGGPLLAEAHAGCAFARVGLKYQAYQRAVAAGALGPEAGSPGRNSSLVQGYLSCLVGQEPRVPASAIRLARAAARDAARAAARAAREAARAKARAAREAARAARDAARAARAARPQLAPATAPVRASEP